jgi:inorganic pyrophosphatase
VAPLIDENQAAPEGESTMPDRAAPDSGDRPAITVFIENEAGSDVKHHYNEETFEVLRTERVGVDYPYPYGFVPGTLAPDGDAADCFVITEVGLPPERRSPVPRSR